MDTLEIKKDTTIEDFMQGAEILEVKQDRVFKETFFLKDGVKYSLLECNGVGSRMIFKCR